LRREEAPRAADYFHVMRWIALQPSTDDRDQLTKLSHALNFVLAGTLSDELFHPTMKLPYTASKWIHVHD